MSNKDFKLTKANIDNATCQPGKGQAFFRDKTIPGLGLRVMESGSKAFIYERRIDGKTVRTTIGDPRVMSIAAAKQRAEELALDASRGVNPNDAKRARIEAAKQAAVVRVQQDVTLRDVWPEFTEAHKAKWGDVWAEMIAKHVSAGGEPWKRGKGVTKAGVLSSLMDTRLVDLSPEVVAVWLEDELEERSTAAHQGFRILRRFVNWANSRKSPYRGMVPADACSDEMVTDLVPVNNAKDDCLERGHLKTWFVTMNSLSNPVFSAYLQALLLTGARRSELAKLTWDKVDFTERTLSLSDKNNKKAKVEKDRKIPLTPYVEALLSNLPRRGAYVFSSTSKTGHIVSPNKAHQTALAKAGLPHMGLHGLRRSFKTLAEWEGTPAGVLAQLMGHKASATAEKHYSVRAMDFLRMWHEKIERFMLAEAGLQFNTPPSAPTPHLKVAA